MADVIFLDTHVVVWLYEGDLEKFNSAIQEDLEAHDLLISPAVALELQYLKEVGKTTVAAKKIVEELTSSIGLAVSDIPFYRVVGEALGQSWTRDPFDRLITAQACLGQDRLLTKDRTICANYKRAYWA